jgi:hypothetical protein
VTTSTATTPKPDGPDGLTHEFCYSPGQRAAILKALPRDVEVDREDLVAKLTVAARIALNPVRVTSEGPSPKSLAPLKAAVASLDNDGRLVLDRAGVNVDRLSELLDVALLMHVPTLKERRHHFVVKLLGVWSATMPAPKHWPLGRVKDGAPLVRLADAALPKQLKRQGAHGKTLGLRKTVNKALVEFDWAVHKHILKNPGRDFGNFVWSEPLEAWPEPLSEYPPR